MIDGRSGNTCGRVLVPVSGILDLPDNQFHKEFIHCYLSFCILTSVIGEDRLLQMKIEFYDGIDVILDIGGMGLQVQDLQLAIFTYLTNIW